ncbi:MAG: hypothetical protein ACYTFW_25435, partial [Planctomycetota bacterium]
RGKIKNPPPDFLLPPGTTYKDEFTLLLHKSQEFLAAIPEDDRNFPGVCPYPTKNEIVLGLKQ